MRTPILVVIIPGMNGLQLSEKIKEVKAFVNALPHYPIAQPWKGRMAHNIGATMMLMIIVLEGLILYFLTH